MVRMRHPNVAGEIDATPSQEPFYRTSGWLTDDERPDTEPGDQPGAKETATPRRRRASREEAE